MTLPRRLAGLMSATAVLAAFCGQPPRPVPSDASNPIQIRFETTATETVIDVVAETVSNVPLQTIEMDHDQGYLETQWVDIALYETFAAESYPLQERFVRYRFEIRRENQEIQRLFIFAIYSPAHVERLVPTEHPGFTLAWRIYDQLRFNLIERGVRLASDDDEQEGNG